MGFHTLPAHRDFQWSFCANIWGRTLFFFEFWWDNILIKTIEVFNFEIGLTCNMTCNWTAKHVGIYFTGNRDPTAGLVKRYNWDPTE